MWGKSLKDLSDREVKGLKKNGAGRYRVSRGLYLEIDENGGQRWLARLQAFNKRHDYGLGNYPQVSLRAAREKTGEYRAALKEGRDPTAQATSAFKIPTFKDAAYRVWEQNAPAWRNAKHKAEWIGTLERYAFPTLGNFRVDQISHALVADTLAKIWLEKHETATRVAQRIKKVMDWAAARQHCNPMSMEVVRAGLPNRKIEVQHFASMPWKEVPEFVASISHARKVTRLALTFCILTAARSGEVRNMRWSEVDLVKAEWRVPGDRMKMGRDHNVPLSKAAIGVLEEAKALAFDDEDPLVFPNNKGTALSDMTLTMVLRRTFPDNPPTVHGFRSSFTDWAAEETNFPREVVDASLAHQTGSKVDIAYRRTDFFDKRRTLMEAWGDWVTSINEVSK